ncbi:hypothetical protein [Paenibacillus sp.]|uniref:hypothetical protein n=1 Tax=Paenibacillus sp. TaxID=58172 RepID=UPI002D6DCDFE|nr:hypothetical protein [Paenibacillus sp.]HZG85171.1 hypothetical protein [Paenibacillus sp.]
MIKPASLIGTQAFLVLEGSSPSPAGPRTAASRRNRTKVVLFPANRTNFALSPHIRLPAAPRAAAVTRRNRTKFVLLQANRTTVVQTHGECGVPKIFFKISTISHFNPGAVSETFELYFYTLRVYQLNK